MRYLTLVLTLYCTLPLLGQNTPRPGYLIDAATGTRAEVYILDRDWADNPSGFKYRTEEGNGDWQTATTDAVSEFGYTDGSLQYRRFTVGIDRSSDQPKLLSTSPVPEYTAETVFLELLVEGPAELYGYSEGNLQRFYFRTGGDTVQPLVSRTYRVGSVGVRRDDSFRGTLRRELSCGPPQDARLAKLRYDRNPLIRYFTEYNDCVGGTSRTPVRRTARGKLSIAPRVGAEQGTIVFGLVSTLGVPAEYELTSHRPRYGLEVEYQLPLANNRWAVFAEVAQRSVRGQRPREFDRTINFYYQAVTVPLGVRRYIDIAGDSGLFIDAAVSLDVPYKSNFTLAGPNLALAIIPTTNPGFEFGLGLNLRDRYQLQVRYGLTRGLTDNYRNYSTEYSTLGVVAAYRIGVF